MGVVCNVEDAPDGDEVMVDNNTYVPDQRVNDVVEEVSSRNVAPLPRTSNHVYVPPTTTYTTSYNAPQEVRTRYVSPVKPIVV